MLIGVLALQGDFQAHAVRLRSLGAKIIEVRKSSELTSINGLVIPGGESSVLLKLLDPRLRENIRQGVAGGLPTFATCAGLILLAQQVRNPVQESLSCLDIDVIRNGYGRQIDSFIARDTLLTLAGSKAVSELMPDAPHNLDAVFIRAPIISRVGPEVEVLAEHNRNPILVRQKNIWAATFHPELDPSSKLVHALFLKSIG